MTLAKKAQNWKNPQHVEQNGQLHFVILHALSSKSAEVGFISHHLNVDKISTR